MFGAPRQGDFSSRPRPLHGPNRTLLLVRIDEAHHCCPYASTRATAGVELFLEVLCCDTIPTRHGAIVSVPSTWNPRLRSSQGWVPPPPFDEPYLGAEQRQPRGPCLVGRANVFAPRSWVAYYHLHHLCSVHSIRSFTMPWERLDTPESVVHRHPRSL